MLNLQSFVALRLPVLFLRFWLKKKIKKLKKNIPLFQK